MRRQANYDAAGYKRLTAAGCPVDPPPSCNALEIYQSGGPGENCVLELKNYIGYYLHLTLIAHKTFYLDRLELEDLPWAARELSLVEPVNKQYTFPGSRFSWPAGDVLNRYVGAGTKLVAGKMLEGFFLAYSWGALPAQHRYSHRLSARVSVYDTRGASSSCICELMLVCEPSPRVTLGKPRSSLFADDPHPALAGPQPQALREPEDHRTASPVARPARFGIFEDRFRSK